MKKRLCTLIFRTLHRRGVTIHGTQNIPLKTEVNIKGKGRLSLQQNVTCMKNVTLSVIDGQMDIGERVLFNRNCILVCRKHISIGDCTMIGPNVVIYDHDHRFGLEGLARSEYKTGDVIIGKGCWIGANAVILRGTTIGDGCVIGAGTVVKGNIPTCSIVTNDRTIRLRHMEQRY